MFKKSTKILIILILFISGLRLSTAQTADKLMLVIIDGARYTETFGDPTFSNIPKMRELAQQGTIISNFVNNNYTYTSRAIPAIWCGAWTNVQSIIYNGSATQHAVLPTIFEYYRKQKNATADDCVYILPYVSSLWLPSFDSNYGPDYWPKFYSQGSSDYDVFLQTQYVMDNTHPQFLLVYLADVDHYGHSGVWTNYVSAIQNADRIVGLLWEKLQSDPFYKNSTNLIVTNDHGRHDDQHGGFQRHGCSCDGCRQIQFLAVGPDIKKNFVSTQYRTIPDVAVTAASLLGLQAEKASGNVMNEIFNFTAIQSEENPIFEFQSCYPNPFLKRTRIQFYLNQAAFTQLDIYAVSGKKIKTLLNEWQTQGQKFIEWDGTDNQGQKTSQGIYFYTFQAGNNSKSEKLILLGEN
jgi:predicted AlkP superfamily pyrophosphatase or phosphodiesterase